MNDLTRPKKNPDFSGSAVSLTNPSDARVYLTNLHGLLNELDDVLAAIENSVPAELKERRDNLEKRIETITNGLKGIIDKQGGYQDVIEGLYALKQRRLSKSYVADKFERLYPQFAPAVIVKAVDIMKLNGLVKGGLLDEGHMELEGVLKLSETYAYVIK